MRVRRTLLWLAALTLLVVILSELQGIGITPGDPLPERCASPGRTDSALFLIGDAGAPRAPEPVLDSLAREARERVEALGAARGAIGFLGANVYPEGLRAADHPGRAEDERRLDAQLAAVRGSGARGVFVPGNHDWSDEEATGWEAIKRQTRYVAARGASVLPPNGCPGPAAIPLGARLVLVAIDTQWWLHRFEKPSDGGSGCATSDRDGFERALAAVLSEAGGRHAIALAHHPLATGGPHGARFGWREHLFPLRDIDGRAWVPLPVLGSVGPLARMLGANEQDLPASPYRSLAEALTRAFAPNPPLVFAAGHDHSLQLVRGGPSRFQVVSGAGSPTELSSAYAVDGSLFHSVEGGYVRVDAFASGTVELTVRAVGREGAGDAYRGCLTP